MYLNKAKFWKRIKSHLKKNKNADLSKSIPIEEFAKYYSNLFSHDDRVSNRSQKVLTGKVNQWFNEMGNTSLDETCFTNSDIEQVIDDLTIGNLYVLIISQMKWSRMVNVII